MQIQLNQVGKRFRYDWIFKGIDYTFETGTQYAVLGPNGSGKSTLMKVLSGHLTPSKGTIHFFNKGKKPIDKDNVYQHLSYAGPYIELIEEFSLKEALRFHQQFKPFKAGLSIGDLIDLLSFQHSKNKEIRFFSSGMKQRLKLVLALCSDTNLVLLDEPTTNLDRQGVDWYLELVERFVEQRLVIVASNVEEDYGFCTKTLNILDYKK